MSAISQPSKLQILAWMRYRRSVDCPPPDGDHIRKMLSWSARPECTGDSGLNVDRHAANAASESHD